MPGRRYKAPSRGSRNRTSPLMKHLKKSDQLIRNPKKWGRTLLGLAIIAAFTVPVFRSGLRDNLTFFEWVVNHTIWGPPVEYIPEEDYAAVFQEEQHNEPANNIANPSTSGFGEGIVNTVKGGRGYNE